jgi:hypothetical protein
MKKIRNNKQHPNVPPIWWQNSKVSYSFFASGSSSFIDFSIINKKKTTVADDESTKSPDSKDH